MNVNPVTERTKKLRSLYLGSPMQKGPVPKSCYGNHPLTIYWLEGYLAALHAPTTLQRRSLAQKAELDNSKVVLGDGELIVGRPDFAMTPEERGRFDTLYQMFSMSPDVSPDGRSDHTALDYRKLLSVGVEGLIDEIEVRKRELTFSPGSMAGDIEKEDFYESCLIELRALADYAKRYETALREAASGADPERAAELAAMADNMAQVPLHPAKTFWQALQSIHFYTFTLRGLYAAGRPDQDLIDLYRADISDGRLTPGFAQELIDNYCMTFALYISPATAAGMMVGGSDENGEAVENELTWMFLAASDHIRMTDPNLGLCVSRKTSDALLRFALGMIGNGCTFPSFWNDDAIAEAFRARGASEADAHRYINSTCVELTVIGRSASWTACPYHNLAQLLLDTLSAGDYADYSALEDAFFRLVAERISAENHYINQLKLERSRNGSEPMLQSCLVGDCIARGKSVGQGGAVYNETMPNFLGFANSVDSLSAIKKLVFEEGRLTLGEYRRALEENFKGHEKLRGEILNGTAHYGNGDGYADSIAIRLADCISRSCRDVYTFEGEHIIPGIFSFSYHVLYGKNTSATPDGRLGGEPLADSAGPAQGRDTSSPTAALLSGTCWPQCDFTGGVAQNIKLSKSFFADGAADAVLTLIKTFFKRGGCELQFNCVDRAELEDAVVSPGAHGGLLVRIGGYSDFFTHLNPALQRDIIRRTEYGI